MTLKSLSYLLNTKTQKSAKIVYRIWCGTWNSNLKRTLVHKYIRICSIKQLSHCCQNILWSGKSSWQTDWTMLIFFPSWVWAHALVRTAWKEVKIPRSDMRYAILKPQRGDYSTAVIFYAALPKTIELGSCYTYGITGHLSFDWFKVGLSWVACIWNGLVYAKIRMF